MTETTKLAQAIAPTAPPYHGAARVLSVSKDGLWIQVMLPGTETDEGASSAPRSVWAQCALPGDCVVEWGDTVLVTGNPGDEAYVFARVATGRVATPNPESGPQREIQLENGMRAESIDGESLSVYGADGRLLFRHDGTAGQSRIDLPEGDIQFVARNGNIDFVTSETIRFTAQREIHLSSLAGVKLAAHDAFKQATSLLEVGPRETSLHTDRFAMQAEDAEVKVERAQFASQRLHLALDRLKSFVKRSETHTETLIEKAKNAYRKVTALDQTTAGRRRVIVDGQYELRSKDAQMRSEDDFKIDGKQIHLG